MGNSLKPNATSRAHENIDLEGYFVYHGRGHKVVPEDVIRVRVHPFVKVIKWRAFYDRRQLTTVTLREERCNLIVHK